MFQDLNAGKLISDPDQCCRKAMYIICFAASTKVLSEFKYIFADLIRTYEGCPLL